MCFEVGGHHPASPPVGRGRTAAAPKQGGPCANAETDCGRALPGGGGRTVSPGPKCAGGSAHGLGSASGSQVCSGRGACGALGCSAPVCRTSGCQAGGSRVIGAFGCVLITTVTCPATMAETKPLAARKALTSGASAWAIGAAGACAAEAAGAHAAEVAGACAAETGAGSVAGGGGNGGKGSYCGGQVCIAASQPSAPGA